MGVVVQWVKPLLRKPTSHSGGLGFKSGYCTYNLISTNIFGRTTVPEPLPPTWETHLRFRTPHLAWPSPGCCWPSGSQPATGRSLCCVCLSLWRPYWHQTPWATLAVRNRKEKRQETALWCREHLGSGPIQSPNLLMQGGTEWQCRYLGPSPPC